MSGPDGGSAGGGGPAAGRRDVVDELTAAVRAAAFHADDALVERIDRAMAETSDPGDVGRLLVTKSLALQGRGDPAGVAELVRAAVPLLVESGQIAHAVFAATTTAVFLDQAGDSATAIEYAVDALVMLEGLELGEVDAARASLALCGFYMRRCAFELAVGLGSRAFDGARQLPGLPLDAVAFSSGYVAAEGGHVTTDPAARERYLAHALTAAEWLCRSGKDDVSRVLLGPGLLAEIALAVGGDVDVDALDAAVPCYEDAIADFVAWHRAVRGIAAAERGDHAAATDLIDEAEPGLRASGDDHCLVRALRTRAAARAALGDLAGAYADASALAEMTRRWQIEQVGGFADQLARRVELERSSSILLSAAERLAADIDTDPLTRVHSRRWLERELDAIERHDGLGSVVMLDIDHFKSVNDTYGHHIGDRVLARVGELLTGAAGPDCEVARFGGEEFAVVVRDRSPQQAVDYAERVRSAVQADRWGQIVRGLALTISAGVADGELAAVRELIVRADSALLEAKRHGRNRVTLSPPAPERLPLD